MVCCNECGLEHGVKNADEEITWYEGECDICKETKPVTEFRDFGVRILHKKCRTCEKDEYGFIGSGLKEFRKVKTRTGSYYRNTCKECDNKDAREKRQRNYKSYNWRKKKSNNYDPSDYGRMFL